MSEDDDYSELETRRRANLKALAIFGLVVVGGLLLYKCASQADRFGLGTGGASPSVIEVSDLEISIGRAELRMRGCMGAPIVVSSDVWASSVEHCVARAKVRARDGGGSWRVAIHVEPGAPAALVGEVQAMVESFELTPVRE